MAQVRLVKVRRDAEPDEARCQRRGAVHQEAQEGVQSDRCTGRAGRLRARLPADQGRVTFRAGSNNLRDSRIMQVWCHTKGLQRTPR